MKQELPLRAQVGSFTWWLPPQCQEPHSGFSNGEGRWAVSGGGAGRRQPENCAVSLLSCSDRDSGHAQGVTEEK